MKEPKNELRGVIFNLADVLTFPETERMQELIQQAAADSQIELQDTPMLRRPVFADLSVWQQLTRPVDGETEESLHTRARTAHDQYLRLLGSNLFGLDCQPQEHISQLFYNLRDHSIKTMISSPLPRRLTNILLYRLGWDRGLNHLFCATGDDASLDMIIAPDSRRRPRPYPDLLYLAQALMRIDQADQMLFISSEAGDWESARQFGCRTYRLEKDRTLTTFARKWQDNINAVA